jgi:hypothetical protein
VTATFIRTEYVAPKKQQLDFGVVHFPFRNGQNQKGRIMVGIIIMRNMAWGPMVLPACLRARKLTGKGRTEKCFGRVRVLSNPEMICGPDAWRSRDHGSTGVSPSRLYEFHIRCGRAAILPLK